MAGLATIIVYGVRVCDIDNEEGRLVYVSREIQYFNECSRIEEITRNA